MDQKINMGQQVIDIENNKQQQIMDKGIPKREIIDQEISKQQQQQQQQQQIIDNEINKQRLSGIKCILQHCGKSRRHNPKIRMFRFPPAESLMGQLWRECCNLKESGRENIVQNLVICDDHFEKELIGTKKLKRDAIPTLNLTKDQDSSFFSSKKKDFIEIKNLRIDVASSSTKSSSTITAQKDINPINLIMNEEESTEENTLPMDNVEIECNFDDAFIQTIDNDKEQETFTSTSEVTLSSDKELNFEKCSNCMKNNESIQFYKQKCARIEKKNKKLKAKLKSTKLNERKFLQKFILLLIEHG